MKSNGVILHWLKKVSLAIGIVAALGVGVWEVIVWASSRQGTAEAASTFETKEHAKERRDEIAEDVATMQTQMTNVEHNVIRIGERLRIGEKMKRPNDAEP